MTNLDRSFQSVSVGVCWFGTVPNPSQWEGTMNDKTAQIETTELPSLITATAAARMIGRDPRTIARWVRQGAVPRLGVEIAGRVYVRVPVLEALARGVEPASVA